MTAQQALTLDTMVKRSQQIVDAEVGGEIVALHIEKGTCYGLNKVGSRIWQLSAESKQISTICRILLEDYDVPADQCEKQVLRLLEGLRSEGLVEVLDQETPATEC